MVEIVSMTPGRPRGARKITLSNTPISFQEVLQLVELIKGSASFSELRIRSGDLEIELRRGGAGQVDGDVTAAAPLEARSPAPSPSATPMSSVEPTRQASPPAAAASRDEANVVKAPMVGTVFLAPEPGAAPFVTLGQKVAPGDQLCIIEVMKLMNAVSAECHGTVTEILVGDGASVEYGQGLYVVSPL